MVATSSTVFIALLSGLASGLGSTESSLLTSSTSVQVGVAIALGVSSPLESH